jgi:chaperonin GroEL
VAFINALPALDGVTMDDPDAQTGVAIIRAALEQPMRKLAENAGMEGAVIVDQVRRQQDEAGNPRLGYDVMSGEFVDMLEAGIIDPAKVTRGALANAASIAAMILTTEALISDKPKKEKAPAGQPGMGDYDDYDF